MAYSLLLLNRSVVGRWTHLLMAWDAAIARLRAGQPRVAIVRADKPGEIVMVLAPVRKGEGAR